MAVEAEFNKRLSIKLNVIKRCLKEIQMYEKEAEKHQERIATMEASNACPHDIKKQYEIMNETRQMIPDCEKCMALAKDDASKYMDAQGFEFDAALVAEAKALLS